MKKIISIITAIVRRRPKPPPLPPVSTEPALPQVFVDTTYVAPTGATINVPAGGNLQTALNNAQPGDTITLDPTGVYGPITLPVKSGSSYIHVRSSATLTPVGTRVTTGQLAGFPKITTPNVSPAIQAAPAAHHYRFINCDIKSSSIAVNGSLVALGSGGETNANDFPHHIIIDRCGVSGSAANGGRRGVMFSGNYQAVIDSYLSDWKEVGADTQAIAGWTGRGPYKIVNNYLEGAGENVLFGGADAQILNLTPSDIEIRGNHFFKPLSWNVYDPSYAGTHWSVKNLLELKHAQRVLISDNLLENCWADGQIGFAILFTGRNQSGGNPWATVSDVTFKDNELRNSDNGVNLLGIDTESGIPSQSSKRLLISHNLMTGIGGHWNGDGVAFMILSGYEDVKIDHNTILNAGNTITADGSPSPRLKFTNNIVQHNQYGIKGSGLNSGNPTIAAFFPNSDIRKNVFATPTEEGWGPFYPPSNFFPNTLQEIGFVNYPSDLHLAPSSPYHQLATDGTDIGYGYSNANGGGGGSMAFALVAHTAAASTNNTSVTTGAIDTTGANLIVLVTSEDVTKTPVPTDSNGNSYTNLTKFGAATSPGVTIWYKLSPIVGAGHTFTNTPSGGGNSFPAIAVLAFSGAGSAGVDASQNGSTGTANTRQPGSITPSENNEVVIASSGWNGAIGVASAVINGGFNSPPDQVDSGSNNYGAAISYLIQTSAAAANPTWTYGVSSPAAAAGIAAFKVTNVAAPVSDSRLLLLGVGF
jgi:hypothetical protein